MKYLYKRCDKNIFTFGLAVCLLAACIFSGCASAPKLSGGGEEPGSLTVTGIPTEYNGKFAHFAWRMEGADWSFRPGNTGGNGIAIANGEVELPFNIGKEGGYIGSDTLSVVLVFADTPDPLQTAAIGGNIMVLEEADAIYTAVSFENGKAVVSWEDEFKVAYISIINFPEDFGDPGTFEDPTSRSIGVAYSTILGSGYRARIINGTLTMKYHHWETGTKSYIPYVENSVEITLSYGATGYVPVPTKGGVTVRGSTEQKEVYSFTVQPESGKTTVVDFSKGVKVE